MTSDELKADAFWYDSPLENDSKYVVALTVAESLRKTAEDWEATAKQYARNTSYWEERCKLAERTLQEK